MTLSQRTIVPLMGVGTGIAVLGLALTLGGGSQTGYAQSSPGPGRTGAQALRDADELIKDLKEARKLVSSINDRKARDRIELLVARSELKAADLRNDLVGLLSIASNRQPMADADFTKLLQQIQSNAFDNGKVTIVKQAASNNRFTTAQVRDILKTFSFDQERTNAALALHPQIVDPGNFFQALDVFTFGTSRDALIKKLTPKPK